MKAKDILRKLKLQHTLKNSLSQNIARYPNILLFLLLISVGTFYFLIWDTAPIEVTDSGAYMRIAQDLQDLKLDKVQGRVPGYALLLWLTNSHEEPTRLLFFIQLSLHLVSVFLLTYLLNRFAVSRKIIGLFLFLALIPPSMILTAYVLTETLTQFLIVLAVVFLLLGIDEGKIPIIIISSIALALAALVRPTNQLIFVAILGILLVFLCRAQKSRKILVRAAFITFLLPTLILGAYAWHNYRTLDSFGLTYLLGFNLSTRTARVVEELPDEYAEIRETLIRVRDSERVSYRSSGPRRPWHNRSHNGLLYIWLTFPELRRITNIESGPELSRYMSRLNLLLIRKAPIQYMKEVLMALPFYWLPLTTDLSNFNSKIIQFFWITLHFVVIMLFFFFVPIVFGYRVFLFTLPAKIKSGVRLKITNKDTIFFLSFFIAIATIIYTMLVSVAADVGNPRHRAPTELLIFFVVALGIHFWINLRKSLSEG